MRLGIDLDGVVAQFNAGWMRLHAAEFGSDLHPDMVVGWDGLHRIAGFASMNDFWRWASPNERRRSIFRHLQPFPGALHALDELASKGHDIVIVTTKPDFARSDTLHWIADNAIPTSEVHMVIDKFTVDCDAYLDDSPHVLADLVKHRPERLICRYVRPWNQPIDGTLNISDWADFHAAVDERSANDASA